ncbi:NUDIX domain-containing protein [Corynebacterium belfantii]|uniref:NUDIX domain-containing protein n=1 Tax=Corynebacterium belfantii TaxID=2014537 RepID=UPI000964FF16|nr:NUDIX hydrolase [Corynebacterium belfantii]OLN15133.1 ADP-ribose pyrophosphatase [Corynebacterium diphtheriae subsp. lausannense]QVI98146.1 NUDIX hydrolase [Corynebacterium diphtheriae]MBG9244700.1 NUDIX hydrolase [Corynebacterium belfantii]MBG9259587.1 NUDIX hydrolase [Corynebacterium belfantii]MBG9266372.1 NUDIX hydrolase [Corynebacterium belfantii]
MTPHSFVVTDSTLLLDAPIIAVRRDKVLMPKGNESYREIVEHYGAVAIVARDESGRILLIKQYRHSVGRRMWELPAGLLDIPSESELQAAQRELKEEAGLASHHWSCIIDLVTSPGFCDEAVRIFLADRVYAVPRPEVSDEEADITTQWVALDDAIEMIMCGRIVNSIAIAGIFAAREHIETGVSLPSAVTEFELRPTSLVQRHQDSAVHRR